MLRGAMADRSMKKWCLLALVVCLLLLGARGTGAEEQGEGGDAWSPPSSHDAEFQKLWGDRHDAIIAGDAIGERQLQEMTERKLDQGIINLWEYATLLIREGMALADEEQAVTLGEFAQRMAPDLPSAYFYTGRTIVERNRWRINAALEKDAAGIKAYTRNIPLAAGQGLNILYVVGLGSLLAILAFCLMVFFKRLPIYLHVLKAEFEGDTQEMIRGMGRIFLLALPFLLQLNIVWCALVWCLILWRYLTKGEKGVVILSFVLVVYITPVGEALFQFMEGPRAQVVFDIYEGSYGERQPRAMERLRLWAQDHPEDRDVLFTVALAAKREGDYAEAKRYYQDIVWLNPSDPDALSNFGNLSMALGDLDQASTLYHKAIELAPNNGVYYFNLSKALSQKSMLVLQDADQNFQKAKELSPQQIGAQVEIDSPHPNRMVIDTVIPLEHLRRRLLAEFWREAGATYFLVDVWLRDLSPRFPFVLPVFFIVAVVALAVVGKGREEWWRCSLCGVISSQTIGKKEGTKSICVRCFRILKGKEIDKGLKGKKLRETKVFQIRMGVYDKLFPFLIPGFGHIWKGYNVRGFSYLWIFFVFVGMFFYRKGVVLPAIPSPNYGMIGAVPMIILVMMVIYLVALWGGYTKEGLEVSKPAFSLEGIRR
jgi:tetratricopeptide (TPR) repeat protein